MYSRWHTILAIDFDRWAAETYRANFPGVRVECGAVADWIDHLPGCDVLLGGPPCQPHSHAGKRQASKDKRDCGPDFVGAVERGQAADVPDGERRGADEQRGRAVRAAAVARRWRQRGTSSRFAFRTR
jgi:site-specific DNA-cytosine methylase